MTLQAELRVRISTEVTCAGGSDRSVEVPGSLDDQEWTRTLKLMDSTHIRLSTTPKSGDYRRPNVIRQWPEWRRRSFRPELPAEDREPCSVPSALLASGLDPSYRQAQDGRGEDASGNPGVIGYQQWEFTDAAKRIPAKTNYPDHKESETTTVWALHLYVRAAHLDDPTS